MTKAQLGIHIVTGGLSNLIDRVCIEVLNLRMTPCGLVLARPTDGPPFSSAPFTPTRTWRTLTQSKLSLKRATGSALLHACTPWTEVLAEGFIEGTTMSLSQLRSLDIELRAAPMIAQLHSVKV